MHTINRAIVIVKMKEPYIDWIRKLPDPDFEITLDQINAEPTCYLIPAVETNAGLLNYLKKRSVEIFKEQMSSWWIDESDWEQDVTWKNFKRWFDFEFCSLAFDLGKNDIEREDREL